MALLQKFHKRIGNPTHQCPIIVNIAHQKLEILISIVLSLSHKNSINIYLISYLLYTWLIILISITLQDPLCAYLTFTMKIKMLIPSCIVTHSLHISMYFQEGMSTIFLSLVLILMIKSIWFSHNTTSISIQMIL